MMTFFIFISLQALGWVVQKTSSPVQMVDVFHGRWLAMEKKIVRMALMSHCSAKNKVSLPFGKISTTTATKNKQNTHQQNEWTNFMRFLLMRRCYDEELWSLKYSTEWFNITNVLEESQICPGLQLLYFPTYKSNGCISQPHFLKLQVDVLLVILIIWLLYSSDAADE